MDNIRQHLHELEHCFESLVAENLWLKKKADAFDGNADVACNASSFKTNDVISTNSSSPKAIRRCTVSFDDDKNRYGAVNFGTAEEAPHGNDLYGNGIPHHENLDDFMELMDEANDDILPERQPDDYFDADPCNGFDVPNGTACPQEFDANVLAEFPHEAAWLHPEPTPVVEHVENELKLDFMLQDDPALRNQNAMDSFADLSSAKKSLRESAFQGGRRSNATYLMPERSRSMHSRDSDAARSRSLQSASGGSEMSLLPSWFQTARTMTRETMEEPTTYSHLLEVLEFEGSLAVYQEKKVWCVMSTFGNLRAVWDVLWRYALAVDIWAATMDLFFVPVEYDSPALGIVEYCTVGFFVLDIIMNFNTGIIKDRREVLRKKEIAMEYLKFWFWVDVASTIPWHWIFQLGNAGSAAQTARTMKVAKSMKMLKMCKLIRVAKVWHYQSKVKTSKAAQAAERMKKDTSARIKRLTEWAKFLKVQSMCLTLMVFAVLAHVNSCVFALVHQGWHGAQADEAVFRHYLESYWWAATQLTFGTTFIADVPRYWLLETAICLQRLTLCFFFIEHIVYRSLIDFEDDARISVKQVEALKYLKEHDVSLDTQIQLLHYISETGQVRKRQRWFQSLMDNDLPPEMQHFLSEELWSAHLLSLGLISHVARIRPHFLSSLCHEVGEQVFPRHGIVCREGDISTCAYYVNAGELVVLFLNVYDTSVPPFLSGMWVGEKALINPELRRAGTVATKSASTLLVVPARAFHALLAETDLEDEFRQFCAEELWKGLCGRCGAVGQHWPTDCPNSTQKRLLSGKKTSSGKGKLTKGSIFTHGSSIISSSAEFAQDLKIYIDYHHLNPAVTTLLEDCKVFSLADLERKQAEVKEAMSDIWDHSLDLNIFTSRSIQKFKKIMSAKINDLLNMRMTSNQHLLFLSHYKVEAGTEAALMRSEIQELMDQDENHSAHVFDAPVYLDSENLTDLHDLMQAVARSHNVALICTRNVLSRPWCLVEIATATRENVPVLPIKLQKDGCEFVFPDDSFYENLENGTLIGQSGVELLAKHGFEMQEVCAAVRKVFMRIALTYSPHRPAMIRKAEMGEFMKLCNLREIKAKIPGHHHSSDSAKASFSQKVHSFTEASCMLMPPGARRPAQSIIQLS